MKDRVGDARPGAMPEQDVATRSRPGWKFDAFLVLAAATINVAGTLLVARHQPQARPLDIVGIAVLLLAPATLWWRHNHPALVLSGCFVLTWTYVWLPYPGGPIYGPVIVALISAVNAGRRLAAYTIVVAALVASAWLPALLGQDPPSLVRSAGLTAWLLFLASVGEVVRYRRALASADRQRLAMTLRAQTEDVRRRAIEDRLQLARELHDVLGHHLAVINVQATAGLELLASEPQKVPQTLRAVRDASRSALLDVQTFLDSLHESADRAPRQPSLSIIDLDQLVAPAQAGGVPVHTSVQGSARALPATVDLAASRVIQEALTNVMRHAGQPTTRVRVTYGINGLTLRVENDKATALPSDQRVGSARGSGRGIPGMRARVRDLGGTLAAGPTHGNAWSVIAQIPIPEETP